MNITFSEIESAYTKIKNTITKTPLVTNDFINDTFEADIYFKLENLQKTGSFKIRGATHKISTLPKNVIKSGVVAYSSGNHAQAVAYAANQKNISAKIIMPKNAPRIKIENTKKYGADVILYDAFFENREKIGNEIKEKENRYLIKPYDDIDVIAGQGTAGIEIADELQNINIIPDIYLCCCGGGGLIAGTSTYLQHKFPNLRSYSVEPEEFDDTKKSLENKKIIENNSKTQSICDALLAPMPGSITFPINLKNLDGGITVSDEEVRKTIILLSEHLKIVVEPGGAVAAAAVLNKKINIKNKKIVVMISGGNIDLKLFRSL
tara:strand:- start:2217 stop:3179 length:963 start_codon:yes stop_codon:yes gene_type:complete